MTRPALPPLTWLRAFEAAARHLSFTLAAQELHLTQSAVSQHVRSLEAYLGRQLFIRRTRALMLTEAGATYLPTVREAFDVLTRGTQSFIGGDPGRSVVIHCNMSFSVYWLAPRLHRLYAAHPWLTLNIATAIWEPVSRAQDAAVEIRFGRPSEMSADSQRMFDNMMFPVCAPNYQSGRHDLQTAQLFDCAGLMGTWEYWAEANDITLIPSRQVNLASTYVIAMTAALHGAGICMSHDTLAADLVATGQLIKPFEGSAPLPEGYYLSAPASRDQTPASRAFIEWLGGEIG